MYVDVYGRDIDKGDVVVVAQYHSTIKESIYVVGPEMYMKDKYICYKLTEPPKGQKNRIKDNIDCLGWSLVPGDLVFLGFKNSKSVYALIIGQGQYMLKTGLLVNFKALDGIKIFQPCKEEIEVKRNLVEIYNKLMSIKSSTMKYINSTQKAQKGEVYLTSDNRSVYIYLGHCGYEVDYYRGCRCKIATTKTKIYNDELFIKLSYQMEYAKKLVDRVRAGETVRLQEVIQHISFKNEDELCVCPFWDKDLVEKLIDIGYLPFHDMDSYKRWLFYDANFSVGEDISKGHQATTCLMMKKFVKITKNTALIGSIRLDKSVSLLDTDKVKVTMCLP